jgi:DNA-binding CsgD family transcriptional regulator
LYNRLHGSRRCPAAWIAGHSDGIPHRAGQTAVILEPARPAGLSSLIIDLHGLTNGERQITQLLLRGLPPAVTARALFITRQILSDHMNAIFAKLDVSGRPGLTALLLDHLLAKYLNRESRGLLQDRYIPATGPAPDGGGAAGPQPNPAAVAPPAWH